MNLVENLRKSEDLPTFWYFLSRGLLHAVIGHRWRDVDDTGPYEPAYTEWCMCGVTR